MKKIKKNMVVSTLVIAALSVFCLTSLAVDTAMAVTDAEVERQIELNKAVKEKKKEVLQETSVAEESKADNGTDPRDFGGKFMPYYRNTELENGAQQYDITIFGMIPITKDIAVTLEIPVGRSQDWTKVDPALNPFFPEEEITGMGDANLRMFGRLGGKKKFLGNQWLAGAEVLFPTHTKPALGSQQVVGSPMIVNVFDLTKYSFVAMMHFYDFTLYGDSTEQDVSRYRGRWFWMFPFPTMTYIMPEFQPIYDFKRDDFDLWIGPEVGQIISPGRIVYIKPGWGISNDRLDQDGGTDREFTFEVGFRMFY